MNSEDDMLCWAAEYAEAYVLSGGQTNVVIDSTLEYELAVESISANWMDNISTQDLFPCGDVMDIDDDDVAVA